MPESLPIGEHTFALARFGRLMQAQPAQVIHFNSGGASLWRDDAPVQQWNWNEITFVGLVYAQSATSLLSMFAGQLPIGGRQSSITIGTAENEILLWLEDDVHYAGDRVVQWLQDLYNAGITVREANARGESTRLLQKI